MRGKRPWGRSVWPTVLAVLAQATAAYAAANPAELPILTQFYTVLRDPGLLAWKGWDTPSSDPCENSWEGVTCDASGNVTAIDLSNYCQGFGMLAVDVPDVDGLKSLQSLKLAMCGVTGLGQIPPSLLAIDLSRNSLAKGMPDLSAAPLLSDIRMSQSGITGTLPCFLLSFASLATLLLHTNSLTGPFPFAKLPDTLRILEVYDNQLDGYIPSGDSVAMFKASNNAFGGTLPSFPEAMIVEVANNQIVGNLTLELYPKASTVRVNSNQIGGTLPAAFDSTMPNLQLYAANNNISGTVPTTWGTNRLMVLSITNNKLTGNLDTVYLDSVASSLVETDGNKWGDPTPPPVPAPPLPPVTLPFCPTPAPPAPPVTPTPHTSVPDTDVPPTPVPTPAADVCFVAKDTCDDSHEDNLASATACLERCLSVPSCQSWAWRSSGQRRCHSCLSTASLVDTNDTTVVGGTRTCTAVPATALPPTPLPPTGAPLPLMTAIPKATAVGATAVPPVDVPATAAPPNTSAPATNIPDTPAPATAAPAKPWMELNNGQAKIVAGGATVAAATAVVGDGAVTATRLAILTLGCQQGEEQLPFALHPTQWRVLDSYSAGAVVGNTAIIVLFGGLCAVAVFTGKKLSFLGTPDIQGFFRFPGLPFFVFQLLFQGTTYGAMKLVLQTESRVLQATGFIAAAACLLVPVVMFRQVTTAVPSKVRYVADWRRSKWESRLLGPGEWLSVEEGNHWARRYGMSMRTYRQDMAWFGIIELAASFALSAMLAMNAKNIAACGHVKVACAAIFAMLLAIEVYLRPHYRLLNTLAAYLSLGLQALAMVFLSVGYYQGKEPPHPWEFAWSASCLMGATGVLLAKTAYDVGVEVTLWVTQHRVRMQDKVFADSRRAQEGDAHNSFLSLDSVLSDTDVAAWGPVRSRSTSTPLPQSPVPTSNLQHVESFNCDQLSLPAAAAALLTPPHTTPITPPEVNKENKEGDLDPVAIILSTPNCFTTTTEALLGPLGPLKANASDVSSVSDDKEAAATSPQLISNRNSSLSRSNTQQSCSPRSRSRTHFVERCFSQSSLGPTTDATDGECSTATLVTSSGRTRLASQHLASPLVSPRRRRSQSLLTGFSLSTDTLDAPASLDREPFQDKRRRRRRLSGANAGSQVGEHSTQDASREDGSSSQNDKPDTLTAALLGNAAARPANQLISGPPVGAWGGQRAKPKQALVRRTQLLTSPPLASATRSSISLEASQLLSSSSESRSPLLPPYASERRRSHTGFGGSTSSLQSPHPRSPTPTSLLGRDDASAELSAGGGTLL